MNIDPTTLLGSLAGAVTAISGIWAAIRHIRYGFQFKKEKERQAILDKANEELSKIEAKLDEKIRLLQEELDLHKENINKDINHMREIYNAEIKTLGERIESLRQDLGVQHSQLVNLLTKLVNKS